MGWIDTRFLARPVTRRVWTAAAAAIGLLAFVALLAGVFDLPRQQHEASLRVEHTLEVLAAASTLEAQFERAVSEGRAYINSAFPDTRERAEAAFARINDDMAALRALTADNPTQLTALEHVSRLIDARIAVLHGMMAYAANGDWDGLRQRTQIRTGSPLTAQILQGIRDVRAEEQRLLKLRQGAADNATRQSVAGLVACGAIASVSGFMALTLLVARRRERLYLAELRRAEALLRTILQTASGPIYAKDLQGRMTVANPAVTNFLGRPWAELEGRTDREFLDDPLDGEAVMANDRQVIAEGKTLVLEERIASERENPRIWLSTKTPMRDAEGAIVGMVGMSVDITDRKRTEERLQAFNAELAAQIEVRTAALAASEARQRAYFDHSPIGMLVMRARDDGNFVLEDLNPAARAAFGFASDSIRGLTPPELWPDLVARDKQEKMRACAQHGQTIEYTAAREIRGETRLLDVMVAPLPDTAGLRFLLICVRDVTRLRDLERQVLEHAEQQAQAAERERAVFQNSADELFVVRVDDEPGGPAFVYEAFSPALESMTGFRPEDLIGRRPEDCLPPALAQPILAIYRRCLAEKSCVKFAESRQLSIGQRDLEGAVSAVCHTVSGRVTRLVGAVRDVTERNRMEAALRQGQKMEAIGRLAAGVAHDFNNILQAVTGSLDLLLEEVDTGTPARDLAAIALDAALRGSHLTHHLLSCARKQMLWPQVIELAAFLPEIERLLARTLGPHIVIDLDIRQEPRARADPGELQTALLNLAINAAHAMPKGGRLRMAAWDERDDVGQSWTHIALTDTGTGMDARTLLQSVEPFFTTKGQNGTGLGLSMAQGFAEQSGGALRIDSTPGIGTTVELLLPVATSAIPTVPARGKPAQAARATPASGRILLVDDSTDVLVTVGAFLDKAGFSVTRAEDGHRALAMLASDRRFDALVSDFAMPGLNGVDLIARARLLKPGLPALIITGYADPGDAEGDDIAVLHKPFQRHELLAALTQVMGQKTAPAGRVQAGG